MHLQDEHLKTALQHAPDRDVQPNAHVRDAVLQYAKKASVPQPSKLQRLRYWLLHEKLSQAQWAGIGSVATVLLVVFMAWQQHPEEHVWITAETSNQNAAHTEMAASAPVPVSQDAEIAPATAPLAQEQLNDFAQEKPIATLNEQDKFDSETPTKRLKGNVIEEKLTGKKSVSKDAETVKPLEKAAHEASQTSVSESNAASKELPAELSAQHQPSPVVAATAPQVNLPESKISLGAADKLESRAIANRTRETLANSHSALVEQLITQGGQKVAHQDIKNEVLRILNVVVHQAEVRNLDACTFHQTPSTNIDAATGLRIENIDICADSEQLQKEVESYNKTMKSGYLQYQGE